MPNGVGEVRGDQPQSRECYAMSLKGKSAVESLPIELLDLRDEAQGTQPVEDLISIPLCKNDDEKVIKIGSSLDSGTQHSLTQFLQENTNVFTWAPVDMPVIDPEIRMYESDIPKTSFVTDQGTYCYRVMPFGLKNAGATYLRLVNKLFRNQIGRNMETAFEDLKQYLSSPPLLTKPEPGEELLLYLSVSPLALAAVLVREEHSQQKPVYYVFKVLHDAEVRYQRVEKLAYALIMAARKLRSYFQAHTIKVLTDQPLKQVLHKPDTSGRLVKWVVELSEFNIQYMPRPAIRAQVLADFVAECTIPQQIIEPEIVQTPAAGKANTTEERTEDGTGTELIPIPPAEQDPSTAEPLWEVHVDGSSNKGGCGAGLVLTGRDNFTLDYALRFGFRASNNEAEYESLLAGMNLAVQTGAQRLKAYCDSQIPRPGNTKADVMSKLAASGYTTLGNICMEFLQKSSIENKAAEVMQVEHESCWMDEIIDYLRSGKLSEAKKEARKVTQRAARFSLDGENLFKRSYTLPYLKYLRPSVAAYVLRETHEGICGEHLGGKALAIKVLLRGLYWPTLRQDALTLVKKCERCQKFPHHSPACCWVEAEPLAQITEQNVQNFFWKSVVCKFGIPRFLITNNGKQFDYRNFQKFCSDLKIEQRFTSVAHPQTNGQTYVTNRILLQGAVIPVDVGTPSPRVANFNEQLNGDGLRANLDLLEEVREESRIRVATYKQKVSNYHDSKNTTVCPREDQVQPKLETPVWSVIDTA
ncbi:uncharacterized protein LOC143850303 [Tasmannia lanceolata]|uniref:uncharacterized protein LOC143850303 n=1 Tax=Tasmannia lanceolata TaxID=3420 RepID=UPI0040641724